MRSSKQSGQTAIELGFAMVSVGIGTVVAMWAKSRFGWIGGVLGFAVGTVSLYCVGRFVAFVEAITYRGRPPFPVCRGGKCHCDDYKYQRLEDGAYGLFCRCGMRYKKRGRRFME